MSHRDTEREGRCTSQFWGGRDQHIPGVAAQLPLPIWRISNNEGPPLKTRQMRAEENTGGYTLLFTTPHIFISMNTYTSHVCVQSDTQLTHIDMCTHIHATHMCYNAHIQQVHPPTYHTQCRPTYKLKQVPNKLYSMRKEGHTLFIHKENSKMLFLSHSDQQDEGFRACANLLNIPHVQ